MPDDHPQPIPQQQSQQTGQVQSQQTQNQSVVQSSQPQYPVSGSHKEHAPLESPVAEYVMPTEVEPSLPQEVEEAGVEVSENYERPQLTDEHKQVGIDHAKESAPVVVTQAPSVQLPYTKDQIEEVKKTTKEDDSKHWLAAFTEYLMKKLTFTATQNQEGGK